MATGLYDDDNLLTGDIKDVLISNEPRFVENILMDSTPRRVTVGTPPDVAKVSLYATDAQSLIIDLCISIGTPLTIKWFDRYATGVAREMPSWDVAENDSHRFYATEILLVVSAQGVQA